MARIFRKWPLSPTTEIVFLSIGGIVYAASETTFISIQESLVELWNVPMSREIFSHFSEYVIKSVLCYVVIARSMLVHINILSYLFVLWSAIFEEKPYLLIPWLITSFVKNLITNFVSLIVGIVVCTLHGTGLPVCIEFLLLQCCKIASSLYMWFSILCLYHQLPWYHRKLSPEQEAICWEELKVRRRKCKYDLSSNSEDADTSSIDESEFEICTRSLDSLVTQLHYDYDWKDSLMQRRYEESPSDSSITVSLAERARRFLRISQDEITLAKRERRVKRVVKVEVGTQTNTLSRKFLETWEKKKSSNKVEKVTEFRISQTDSSEQITKTVYGRRSKSVEITRNYKKK